MTTFEQIKNYYFKTVPILTEEIWENMESSFIVQEIKKGQHYITPGTVEDYVAFVDKGSFRYYNVIEDKEIISSFIFENCYMSEYESFLSRKPAKSFIQALEDSLVIKTHFNDVQNAYQVSPELEKFGRLIAEDLFMGLSERINSLMNGTPEQRYQEILEKQPELLQRVPQYMIASYIGVTPEALSRIRKRILV